MSQFTGGIWYSISEVPLMLIPIVAWVASRRRPPWNLRTAMIRPDPRGGGQP
jgi:hypothetical protein